MQQKNWLNPVIGLNMIGRLWQQLSTTKLAMNKCHLIALKKMPSARWVIVLNLLAAIIMGASLGGVPLSSALAQSSSSQSANASPSQKKGGVIEGRLLNAGEVPPNATLQMLLMHFVLGKDGVPQGSLVASKQIKVGSSYRFTNVPIDRFAAYQLAAQFNGSWWRTRPFSFASGETQLVRDLDFATALSNKGLSGKGMSTDSTVGQSARNTGANTAENTAKNTAEPTIKKTELSLIEVVLAVEPQIGMIKVTEVIHLHYPAMLSKRGEPVALSIDVPLAANDQNVVHQSTPALEMQWKGNTLQISGKPTAGFHSLGIQYWLPSWWGSQQMTKRYPKSVSLMSVIVAEGAGWAESPGFTKGDSRNIEKIRYRVWSRRNIAANTLLPIALSGIPPRREIYFLLIGLLGLGLPMMLGLKYFIRSRRAASLHSKQ